MGSTKDKSKMRPVRLNEIVAILVRSLLLMVSLTTAAQACEGRVRFYADDDLQGAHFDLCGDRSDYQGFAYDPPYIDQVSSWHYQVSSFECIDENIDSVILINGNGYEKCTYDCKDGRTLRRHRVYQGTRVYQGCDNLATGAKILFKPYKIGGSGPSSGGIVIDVDSAGVHGTEIYYEDSKSYLTYPKAKKWAENLNGGWKLIAPYEWKMLTKALNNQDISASNYLNSRYGIYRKDYWSYNAATRLDGSGRYDICVGWGQCQTKELPKGHRLTAYATRKF